MNRNISDGHASNKCIAHQSQPRELLDTPLTSVFSINVDVFDKIPESINITGRKYVNQKTSYMNIRHFLRSTETYLNNQINMEEMLSWSPAIRK